MDFFYKFQKEKRRNIRIFFLFCYTLHMKKRTVFFAIFCLFTSFSLFLFWLWGNIFSPFLPEDEKYSTLLYDRTGQLISFSLSQNEQYHLPPADFSEISPYFLQAVIAIEDDNFFAHGTIDFPAIVRAFFQNITSGRIISGASTLSQQLAKKILHSTHRSIWSKVKEIAIGFSLEKNYSKEEIFSLWSNMAPFSSNIVGISAASQYFFHTSPKNLSLAQAAYLAGIPKNPSYYSPFQFPDLVLQRQRFVLNTMREKNFISLEEYHEALQEEVSPFLHAEKNRAPHFSAFIASLFPHTYILQSSLSLGLQEKIKTIIQKHLSFLQKNNAHNAAVVVIENSTGALLSYVGSADFFNVETNGQVDILRSYRQVGSTLKPFLYALAFEKLGYTPKSIVYDEPTSFETALGNSFQPKDFDLLYKGKMTVAEALAQSRNIPAVRTLSKIGEKSFFDFLQRLGFSFLQKENDVGLSLALGAAETRPIDLAHAYALLAREGKSLILCTQLPCFPQSGEQIFPKNIAREITHILADNTLRIGAFGEKSELNLPFAVAAKTGTTRNFNDNYTVGFSPEYTILVWVGNADGSEMREVSGISGAGPIFHDIFLLLPTEKKFPEQEHSASDTRAAKSTIFDTREKKSNTLRILSPLAGERFRIDSLRNISAQKISFSTTIIADFFLDEEFLGRGEKILWIPKKGKHILRVLSDKEKKEVSFFVD